MCIGQNLKPSALIELADKNTPSTDEDCQPPSNKILAVFNKYKAILPPEIFQNTAQKVLRRKQSKPEERKKQGINAKKSNLSKAKENTDDICFICKAHDPPFSDGAEENEDHLVSRICCDGCTLWCHMVCSGISASDVPSQWLCLNCKEIC